MRDRNRQRTQTISLTDTERKMVLEESAQYERKQQELLDKIGSLGEGFSQQGDSRRPAAENGEGDSPEEIPGKTAAADPQDPAQEVQEELPEEDPAKASDSPEETGPSEKTGPSEETESSEETEPPQEDRPEEGDTHGAASAGHTVTPRKRTRKHRKKNWLLRLLIAAAVIAAFIVVANLQYFEVTQIPVIGNKNVSDKKILKLSGIEEGDSIFFVNPWLVSSRIKKNLYIEEVKVDRQLPRTVEIVVKERPMAAQLARITKKGKIRYVVIDENGMVMGKPKKKKKVTMIDNVTVLKAEKGSTIKVDDKGVYRKSMELISTAKEGDLYFKRIRIRGSMCRAHIYDHLVVKGRYTNVMGSIRSGALKAVVYKLYQEDVTKGTINIGDNNYCSFTPQN